MAWWNYEPTKKPLYKAQNKLHTIGPKKLDRLGRIENLLLTILVYAGLLVLPWLSAWLADMLFFHDAPALVRYPALIVIALFVGFVALALAAVIEGSFTGLRRLLGMRPLSEVEREIADEKAEQEGKQTQWKEQWIAGLTESEFRVRTYLMQEEQLRRTEKIHERVEMLFWAAVAAFVVALIKQYF